MKTRSLLILLLAAISVFSMGATGLADDLSFSVTVTPPSVRIGNDINYHCVCTNVGTTTVSTFYLYSGPDNETSNNDIYTSYDSSNPQPFYVDQTGFKYINFPVSSLSPGQSTSLNIHYTAIANGHAVRLMGVSSPADSDPSNDSSDADCTISSTAPTPAPPPHGGLSATTFTVNESSTPSTNVVDTVLRFAAVQTGQPANLKVRVQATTTPNTEASWKDLTNGYNGVMTYNTAAKKFVLGSLNYPLSNGVYFRAKASGSGYPDSISNNVGPFNLASNRPRLTPPVISLTANGPFADLYVRASIPTANSSIYMRVQTSTNPSDELSWTDLSGGQMAASDDPTRYFLLTNKVPSGTGIYFRVFETRLGYVNGITKASGPYAITAVTPPKVTMIPPRGTSGAGTSANPLIISAGALHFGANALSPDKPIKELALMVDGSPIYSVASQHAEVDYNTNVIGDHLLEASATDASGATARVSDAAVYIRIVPAASAAETRSGGQTGGSRAASTSSGKVFTLIKNNGHWNDATSWRDSQGKSGVPGPDDLAVISNANTVNITAPVTVKSISLDGDIRNVKDIPAPQIDLTVTGNLTISKGGGDLFNLHLIINPGATCELLNSEEQALITGSVDNYGKFNVHGSEGIFGLLHFNNHGTSNFQVPLAIPAGAGKNPAIDNRNIQATSIANSGIVIGSLRSITTDETTFIKLNGVASLITQDGGGLITQDGAGVISSDSAGVISSDSAGLITQDGGGLITQDGGGIQVPSNEHAVTAPNGLTQTDGDIDLDAVHLQGPVTLSGGTLSGTGVIYGNLTNSGGYILPGHSAGSIVVTGSFAQGAKGTLILEDGGALPSQFDQLYVGGAANLGGTLDVKLLNGYKPNIADTFNPLAYSSHAGNFAHVSSNGHVTVNATGILTTVNKSIAQPVSGHPLNISTRLEVQNGSNVLIAGFIVIGPAGSSKNVLIRGLGPSLPLAGALQDPVLELHRSNGSVVTNDNWKSTQRAVIEATGIPPKNDLESAIVATLPAGSYTAILKGVTGGTGIGLVEVYDLDDEAKATAILGNISTRGFVNTGDNVMIGGFIVGGTEPAKILVRALGPSLTAQKVQGALPDTVLELHDANGDSIVNDDWRETQESEIIASTIAPTNNRESAIVATLTPGNYTAVVRGKNNTTGVALVEAYALQ